MKEQIIKWWEGKVSQWFVNNLNRDSQTKTRKMSLFIGKHFKGYHLHQNPKKNAMTVAAKLAAGAMAATKLTSP